LAIGTASRVAGLRCASTQNEETRAMRNMGILLAGAMALAACSNNPPPAPPVDINNPLFAPAFLAQAASGDQFEIQSSQLALQMSQNLAVRNFANMLITDHMRMNQAMGRSEERRVGKE